MHALPVRILILLTIGWANIYCCCDAPAPANANQVKAKTCCTEKHSPAQPTSDHGRPDGRKCDDCPYFAIRQNTLIPDTQHTTVSPVALCLFIAPNALIVASSSIDRSTAIDWSDPVKIPTALLDLHTSLLR